LAVGLLLAVLGSGVASAEPLVQHHMHDLHRTDRHLDVLRRARHQRLLGINRELRLVRTRLAELSSPVVIGARWQLAHRHLRATAFHLRIRKARFLRFERRVMGRFERRRAELASWLDEWGVFKRCPVDGPTAPAHNFGITVRLPGVPVHRHMGDDISASEGTPIVAPFDGIASASSSELGGLEVRVTGALGYVYNAHLSAYGALGAVHMGQVIGYVGHTGDATTPHDHFEWHPGSGPAVDPAPLLDVVC
jgi:murein DD-endopeptidase MepM/ murein hydrolase activator NlpD